MLVALALYVTLPAPVLLGSRFTTEFRFIVPVLELGLLIPLAVSAPHREPVESGRRRRAAIIMIAIISFANFVALRFLIEQLLDPSAALTGRTLLEAAVQIWATNVIAFGLWYWELDGGGPPARSGAERQSGLRFPPDERSRVAPNGWYPRFLDYLYVSFTNSTAFSPTDTMPLTHWAKTLMMTQSLASLLTLLLWVPGP